MIDLLNLLGRSVALSLLVLLAMGLARRRSAAVRHLVVTAGLAATVALPLLGLLVPSWRIPVPSRPMPFAASAPPAAPAVVVAPALPAAGFGAIAPPAAASSERPGPNLWAVVWLSGSLAFLGRWAAALLVLRQRLQGATPVGGLDAPVPVVESATARAPFVAWAFRPRIVLPPGWREWPAARLDVALRHEAAHLERGDGFGLLVARLALAAAWPNPVVWLLVRAESRLAERATDEFVVAHGVPAWLYARELLALAQGATATGPLPTLGMARSPEVAQRIEMILKTPSPRPLVTPKVRRGALLAALVLALPLAVAQPLARSSAAAPPAQDAPKGPAANAIAVTAVADPLAFVLRCEVVRAPRPGAVATRGTATKPILAGAAPAPVLRAPDLYTRNGVPGALKVTLDGIERTVELRPTTGGDLKSTLQIAMSMPFQGARMAYNVLFYTAPANGWVRYPLNDLSGRYTGYQMLVQVSPFTSAAPPSTDPLSGVTAERGAPVLVECRVVHAEGVSVPETRVTVDEPAPGRPGSDSIVARPRFVTREGVPASVELTDGDARVRLAVQVMPGPGGRRMVFLDGKLRRKGSPEQNLTVFSTLERGRWLRTPYRDANGKSHGDTLVVRVTPAPARP